MKRNQDLLSLNPPAKWRHQQTFHQLALRIQCRASVNTWYPPAQIPGSTHHHGSSNNTTHCTKPTRGYLVLPASALGVDKSHWHSRMLGESPEISHSLVFTQSHWNEGHIMCIHMVPKDHLAHSRTAVGKHHGRVR